MHEDFQQLALTFPTIKHNCPGVTAALVANENPRMATIALLDCLHKWLDMDIEEAERQAALFILNLWRRSSQGGEWPAFDMYEALAVWDDDHRTAFQAWALRPWRP